MNYGDWGNILIAIGYVRSRYVQFSAYRNYTSGPTANTGILNEIFEIFTPGSPKGC